MTTSNPILEADKRLLTEYLTERIRTRISGRDALDLTDDMPSRSFFAGVLQPMRVGQPSSQTSSTAIGLDFRVRPSRAQKTIEIRIEAEWCVYHVVFPSWEACKKANSQILSPSSGPKESNDVRNVEDNDTLGVSGDSEEPEEAERRNEKEEGTVIMPRTWRRVRIVMQPVIANIPIEGTQIMDMGSLEISDAINNANVQAVNDVDCWRHLGEPDQHVRTLGDVSVLRDRSTYLAALKGINGDPAPLPPWSASLGLESRPDATDASLLRLRVLLSNTTLDFDPLVQDRGLEDRNLFDAKLRITIQGGELVPFDFLLAPKDYKSNPQMIAKGMNCVALMDEEATLLTETLPVFRQQLYRTRDALEVPFTSLDASDPTVRLEELAEAMDEYLAQWDAYLERGYVGTLTTRGVEACREDRQEFEREITRYRLGIQALREDRNLLSAFGMMNRAFAQLGSRGGGRLSSWRLFQIIFIVSQMPALAVREFSPEKENALSTTFRSIHEEVTILWFPTGGGKTEAYLGLIAVALLFDRLRGKERGVSAWMRFPLRMLSLQQLERLGGIIAILNEIRAEIPEIRTGDIFAMGYYVGEGNTPNRISEDDMRSYEQKPSLREDAKLLRKCPHCGSNVTIDPRRQDWRLAHKCTNSNCFSNNSPSLGNMMGSLPLFIVDNEIYRYLPTVLVGTVDKLAIIARNRYFSHIVRGVRQRCPKHGYTSYDECIEKFAGCTVKKRDLEEIGVTKDPGPSLLIQDELHLLRGELGVFNGHYEGLLKYLGARAHMPPKVLAATATIEAYDSHAFHVYLSRARRFPQPAWRLGESFYATSEPRTFRRFYLGILGHTRGIEEPALKVLTIYIDEIRRLKAAPRLALQIMNRRDLTDEDAASVLRLYDLELCYVNRKATGGSIIDKLGQVERKLLQEGLGKLQTKLLTGDQSMEEVGSTLDRIDQERQETADPRLDVVVATNLISHGVDLERINMMTICGMPSHYAEYLQSTSRSSRSHPGLVAVCFRATDPREVSQYEFFPVMHEHIDRLIEAVAVNRFASFAPQKTIPGLISGLLLCQWSPEMYGGQLSRPLDHVPTLNVALGNRPGGKAGTQSGCLPKEDLRSAIHQIIGVDKVRPPASPSQVKNVRSRIDDVFDTLMAAISRSLENQIKDVLMPITSFRDVDEGIEFGSIDSADYALRLRSR